ncbi:MAG: DNA/RNA nuclease SfsA [Methanobacteriaceae archaeon]|nr:DNA/RNA nuclease SfsA [Methanobacteriaceae archaeon]
MYFNGLIKGFFKSRPNRFVVEFSDEKGLVDIAHLHDPGRLTELLIEDKELLLEYVPNYKETNRKTKYNVIAVFYNNSWVIINSSFHNDLVEELINNKCIKPLKEFYVKKREYTHGNSRLDFLLSSSNDELMFMEVKGCTLVKNSVAMFPDAPTIRGSKHVQELIKIKKDGFLSCVLILVLQNNAKSFTPNKETDPVFYETLKEAYNKDVIILPFKIKTEYIGNCLKLIPTELIPLKF